VRLVVEGTIVVIVPFIVLFLFGTFSLLAVVFYSAVCICIANDVVQVLIIPILPLAAFLQWSETASRVPMRTLSVVKRLTLNTIVTVEN
jgi:hypothetical protein